MDQLRRQMNLDKLFDNVIQYAIDSYIFYFDSIESYYSRREPSFKRKTNFYLTFTLLVVFTVKYGHGHTIIVPRQTAMDTIERRDIDVR